LGLFTALFLLGAALTVLLVSSRRMPAREITVPTLPRGVGAEAVRPLPVVRGETGSPPARVPTILVNNRKVRLNYNISDVGPSGVSAVELWATRDGHHWQRYSNEPPPAGPLVVHVAEEGRYGFTIVVRNGLGVSSPAPQTGEAPQLWVEVDETCPQVKINDVHVGRDSEEGSVALHYTVSDANLCGRPVSISMSTSKDGPWSPIAGGLENSGEYEWKLPKDLPYQVYLRVEACDRAGNVGADGTLEPIKIDQARPRGTILGVDQDGKVRCKGCDEPKEQTPVIDFEGSDYR
jgi:hypothetical protein